MAVTKTPAKKTAARKVAVKKKPAVKATSNKTGQEVSVMLHSYIPSPDIAKKYVGRKIHGVWDATVADIASAEQRNILLKGDTGAGKTLFGEAYASHKVRPYYSLPCDVSIDPSALFGRMQPTDVPGKFKWQDGPVTDIVRGPCGLGDKCEDPHCFAGVLNISEINFMTPKIAASMYPLLDGRRYIPLLGHEGEVVRAHKGLVIIADMNPNYRGTMELNAAFKNRFDFKIDWGYSKEVEEQLVKFPTLRDMAWKMRDLDEIVTPVSTNMLMEFEEFATHPALSLDFAIHNFLGAFEAEEVRPVNNVFTLERVNLEKDIRFFKRSSSSASQPVKDEDLEEMDFDLEEE